MSFCPCRNGICLLAATGVLLSLTLPEIQASRLGWRGQGAETLVEPTTTPPPAPQRLPNTQQRTSSVPKPSVAKNIPATLKLSLEDCIRMSLESNLTLLSRRLDPDVAAAQLRDASSVFEPDFTALAEHSRSQFNPRTEERNFLDSTESSVTTLRAGLGGLLPPGTSYDLSAVNTSSLSPATGFSAQHSSVLRFDVTQPLLRGFGTNINMAGIRIGREALMASLADYETFLSSLVRNIHDAYHDVLFFRANLAARNEDLTLAEQLLTDNQSRVELGTMASLDITQARAAVFARRVDLLRAERQLLNSENALKRLIFSDITPYLDTRIIPSEVPPPPTKFDPVKNRLTALSKRPEIRSANARIKQSLISLEVAKNNLLPRLDVSAGAQTRGRDDDFWTSWQDASDGYETGWNVGALLNIPLGFASERARRDVALLRVEQTQLALSSLQQDIILEVETNIGNVETARLANAAAREARIFSQESLDAEEELLKNGASTTFRVSQIQRELSDARISELRTLLDWNRALAALALSEGTILERYGVTVVVDPPLYSQPKSSSGKKR